MNARRLATLLAAACLAIGALLLGEQLWLAAKAQVARRLIDRAFAAHLRDGAAHRPWRWADTYPVARLEIPRLGERRTVLAGASGSSLTFGPGHVDGTAAPNAEGNCVIAGHRDGAFAFLRDLRPGDVIDVRTREGLVRYAVEQARVRSMWDGDVAAPSAARRLTLLTCYPFGGLRGSSLRWVVTCRPLQPAARTTAAKEPASSEAPPMRPPSTSGKWNSSAALPA